MNPDSKEEGINVIHHSSFFDTPSIKSKVFQSFNLKKNANPFTEENPVYSKGFLLKRSLSSHNPKKRHFFLAEDGIYYGKDVNTNSVNKYMCYENTRVLFETPADVFDKKKAFKECKYVMKFFRNYHIAEIGTDDWDIYEYWKEFLAYKCIQHTFHEEFEVKKMIGKGSFAKVCIFLSFFL